MGSEKTVDHTKTSRSLTCIGCPLGCQITVELEGDTVISVTGNTCPRGDAYVRKEVTTPVRIVTSTVRVKSGTISMVSVKTAGEIPKGKIFDCVKALKDIEVTAPVKIGQIVLQNVVGAGVDIVATKNVAATCE